MIISKIISAAPVITALICLGVLSGCSESVGEAAQKEGRVVVYSSTDEPFFEEVIESFERQNPQIKVEYHAMTAADVHQRYLADTNFDRPSADLLINSAMDLQIRLANDGHAREYSPPQPQHIPNWASWNQRAYAVSVEPIVIGYNRREVDASKLVPTRSGLASFIRDHSAELSGKVGLYDPETSSLGMLLVNQDLNIDQESWDLIVTLGRHKPRLYVSTQDMIKDVRSGKLLLAYNMIGSYAFQRARQDPSFGIIVPQDYTLMMSRVAVMPKNSRHPNAAVRLMDFLLSQEGQKLIAQRGMVPVRDDVQSPYPELTRSNIRAVRVGPTLLTNLDTMNRTRFLQQWKSAVLVD
ncbi:AfuA ABC-type Fe3+ transport system, periplasmic component [Sphingomonadaceae bacterium]